jgi:hypothetical protein
MRAAGFGSAEVKSITAPARFPSLDAWVEAEVRGWIGGAFGGEAYAALLADARATLGRYERPDGSVEFELPQSSPPVSSASEFDRRPGGVHQRAVGARPAMNDPFRSHVVALKACPRSDRP